MSLYTFVRRLKGLPKPCLFTFDGAEMTVHGVFINGFGDGFLNGQGSGGGYGKSDYDGYGAPGTSPQGNGFGDSILVEWGHHVNS